MKTTNILNMAILTLGFGLLASCSQNAKQTTSENEMQDDTSMEIGSITVDPQQSVVTWAGESFGVYTHTGTIKLTKSDLTMKEGKIEGGSFSVDMRTISTTDDNYDAEKGNTPEKLVGHLMSSDFFDADNFPVATFEITSVEGNTASGMMTIRGITNEEKVENINIQKMGDKVKISGTLTFDRKKYDVAWDYPMKEMVLSDEVALKIELIGS